MEIRRDKIVMDVNGFESVHRTAGKCPEFIYECHQHPENAIFFFLVFSNTTSDKSNAILVVTRNNLFNLLMHVVWEV